MFPGSAPPLAGSARVHRHAACVPACGFQPSILLDPAHHGGPGMAPKARQASCTQLQSQPPQERVQVHWCRRLPPLHASYTCLPVCSARPPRWRRAWLAVLPLVRAALDPTQGREHLWIVVDVTARDAEIVGRYQLGRLLGTGAFGAVRLARNLTTGELKGSFGLGCRQTVGAGRPSAGLSAQGRI